MWRKWRHYYTARHLAAMTVEDSTHRLGVWTGRKAFQIAVRKRGRRPAYCMRHRKSPYNRNSVGDPRHYNFNEAITRRLHSNNDIHVIRSSAPLCRTRKSDNGANLTLQYDEIKSGHGIWCGMYNWCWSTWLCVIMLTHRRDKLGYWSVCLGPTTTWKWVAYYYSEK